MSLIVEDGTGKSDAESYATVAAFQTYFANRKIDVTALDTATIEAMLRTSTDYMTGYYRLSWKGERKTLTQALDWPRWNVSMSDVPGGYGSYPYILSNTIVPAEVANACILLAWKAYNAANYELAPDIDRETLKEKVDVIEVEYNPNRPAFIRYRAVELMLKPYMQSANGAGARLVRC